MRAAHITQNRIAESTCTASVFPVGPHDGLDQTAIEVRHRETRRVVCWAPTWLGDSVGLSIDCARRRLRRIVWGACGPRSLDRVARRHAAVRGLDDRAAGTVVFMMVLQAQCILDIDLQRVGRVDWLTVAATEEAVSEVKAGLPNWTRTWRLRPSWMYERYEQSAEPRRGPGEQPRIDCSVVAVGRQRSADASLGLPLQMLHCAGGVRPGANRDGNRLPDGPSGASPLISA